MALTITPVPDSIFQFGNFTGVIVKCVPAASDYPTAGYALGPAQVGLRTLAFVEPRPSTGSTTPATTMPMLAWDPFAQKLQAFEVGAIASTPATAALLTEVGANTDLSAFEFTLLCLGTP